MTPFKMSTNQKLIPNKINFNYTEGALRKANLASHKNNKQPKFQLGDYLRVPDKRNIYSKGYTTNWNGEMFK